VTGPQKKERRGHRTRPVNRFRTRDQRGDTPAAQYPEKESNLHDRVS